MPRQWYLLSVRLGFWSGWITLIAIGIALAIPVGFRLRNARRAPPESSTVRAHVMLGTGVAGLAFLHALMSLFSLGSESAIEAGDAALALGGGAILVLIAHAGIGLQLRNPKLRDRIHKRRVHQITASLIIGLVLGHAWLLLRAAP